MIERKIVVKSKRKLSRGIKAKGTAMNVKH